jgi:hypothetical protein
VGWGQWPFLGICSRLFIMLTAKWLGAFRVDWFVVAVVDVES